MGLLILAYLNILSATAAADKENWNEFKQSLIYVIILLKNVFLGPRRGARCPQREYATQRLIFLTFLANTDTEKH
jgi:hypothetical protein